MQIHKLYLLTGCNLGDRMASMQYAAKLIEVLIGYITRSSQIYSTKAWGKTDQPDFLNQVLEIETVLEPQAVMHQILTIEQQFGRIRKEKWTARTMDIDILFFDELITDEPGLQIPHPRIGERKFVLEPLNEIASDLIHPLLGKTVTQLLAECPDELNVESLTPGHEV